MKYLSTCYRYSLNVSTVITPYPVIFEYGANSKSSKPHIRNYAKKWTIYCKKSSLLFPIFENLDQMDQHILRNTLDTAGFSPILFKIHKKLNLVYL